MISDLNWNKISFKIDLHIVDNDIGFDIDIAGDLHFVTETNHQRKKQDRSPCQYRGSDRTSDLVIGSNRIEGNANGFYDLT